jgi:photosystem II stability/assembly factor-like uncharacterized protein
MIFHSGILQTTIHSYANRLDGELFFVGANGYIGYVSLDGTVYDVSPSGYGAYTFKDIDFTSNREKGFAVTSDGLVFNSTDFGRTWASATTVSLTDVRVLKVSPLDYVFIGGVNSGNNNKIFRSTNLTSYSLVWSESDSNPIEDLTFDGLDHVYAIDLGEVYVSNDEGASFFKYTDFGGFNDGIFCYDSNHIAVSREVAGDSLQLTTSGFTGPTYVGFGTFTKDAKSLWMTSPDYVHLSFADGYVGRVSGTTIDYFTQLFSTTDDCEDIAFAPDNQTGYVCVNTRLYKTTNNGTNWSLFKSGLTSTISAIKVY